MRTLRRTLLYAGTGVLLYVAIQTLLVSTRETLIMHTTDPGAEDRYSTLWFHEEGQFTWIRAENPTLPWVPQLRTNPLVQIKKDGRTVDYRASFLDSADARAFVNAKFREKYGLADRIRAFFEQRDVLAIRLEPI